MHILFRAYIYIYTKATNQITPCSMYNYQSRETEEHTEEQQHTDRGRQRLVLPEDGFEWKKYGQKFIKNIGKFRYRYVEFSMHFVCVASFSLHTRVSDIYIL